jgi:dTDP-4-amino-4,6-dideoxygalactose transaminase
MISFNKPYLSGKETIYIEDAIRLGQISGNGAYTRKCQSFFESKYGFKKCLLTTSCTDALEMSAILCDISTDDEVIIPSYTFVSTALAFVRQGAKIVFADSAFDNPNIDANQIEQLITSRTKAIVVVHYAGFACDMHVIMEIANKHNLFVIEDAAQAIDSYYYGVETDGGTVGKKALGSFGHFATFSFHETKNIISGEGGMLVVNDERFVKRAEIIWEKGTNRAEFFRGEVNKYGWVDVGSSFLPSEIVSAFLWAQIENLDVIQTKRKKIWNNYYNSLKVLADLGKFSLPCFPEYSENNGHMFYLVCNSLEDRTSLISFLKEQGVMSVFHYLSLHSSPFYLDKHDGRILPNSDKFADCLVRLPLYFELEMDQQTYIIEKIRSHFA